MNNVMIITCTKIVSKWLNVTIVLLISSFKATLQEV